MTRIRKDLLFSCVTWVPEEGDPELVFVTPGCHRRTVLLLFSFPPFFMASSPNVTSSLLKITTWLRDRKSQTGRRGSREGQRAPRNSNTFRAFSQKPPQWQYFLFTSQLLPFLQRGAEHISFWLSRLLPLRYSWDTGGCFVLFCFCEHTKQIMKN